MRKIQIIVIIALLSVPGLIWSQTNDQEEKKYKVEWTGFVKNDFFFDSRQTVNAREGHFLLFPAAKNIDAEGKDINAQPTINFLSIQSRLTAKLSGPDALGAKTSGVIEGAFFGHSNGDINGFRLRHAFVKLDWDKTQLLFGQYWHMMFVPECFPGTVSFNTGVPFQYFSRNPQIRVTRKIGKKIKFAFAVATQRDFASPGGYKSLSNSAIPDMQAQMQITPSESFLLGFTGGYKFLKPRLTTSQSYIAKNMVGGFTSNMFLKLKTKPITFKAQAIWAQNAFDGLMIGGFMIQDIVDTIRDYRKYTPVNTLSIWTDIHSNGKKYQFGLFAGYTKNMGSFDAIEDNLFSTFFPGLYSRGSNIDYIYRISPRVHGNFGKFRLAAEFEYTAAAYVTRDSNGKLNMNEFAKITDSEIVSNLRVLFAAYYFF